MMGRVPVPIQLRSGLLLAIPGTQRASFLDEVRADSPAFAWAVQYTSTWTFTNILSYGTRHAVASGGSNTFRLVGAITGQAGDAAWRAECTSSQFAAAAIGPIVVSSEGNGYAMELVMRPVELSVHSDRAWECTLLGTTSFTAGLFLGNAVVTDSVGTVHWRPEFVGPIVSNRKASNVATPGRWLHLIGTVGSTDASLRAALWANGSLHDIYSVTAGVAGATPVLSHQIYAGYGMPGYVPEQSRIVMDIEFAAVYQRALADQRVVAHYTTLVLGPSTHPDATYVRAPGVWTLPASYAARGDTACTVTVVMQASEQPTTLVPAFTTQGSPGAYMAGGLALGTRSGTVLGLVQNDLGSQTTVSGSWNTTSLAVATIVHDPSSASPYDALYLDTALVHSVAGPVSWTGRNRVIIGGTASLTAYQGVVSGVYVFSGALHANDVRLIYESITTAPPDSYSLEFYGGIRGAA